MTAQETGLASEFRPRVVESIQVILADLLERSEPITEQMRLMDELGLSSTLGLELLLQLEDRLEIVIDVEQLDQDSMGTVGDIATFVAGNSRPL